MSERQEQGASFQDRAVTASPPSPAVSSVPVSIPCADECARMWRNAVTNTTIIVDLVRKRHRKSLRRSKAFEAFDTELDDALEAWFRATRIISPATYQEAEAVFKQHLAIGIETGTAETERLGPKAESPAIAQTPPGVSND